MPPVARRWAIDCLADRWGTLVTIADPMPFVAGGYYRSQMGDDLQKVMVACESPVDPDGLVAWKLQTNEWEKEYAGFGEHDEARPLNLDPGYVTQAKLVLATTKDRDHRV